MEKSFVLDPDLPIVDAHHHLWDGGVHPRYMVDEFYADINGSGHNVIGSVYVDCKAMYRADGPEAFRCVGEVEFARGCAAIGASQTYGKAKICAGIVGRVDLTGGAVVGAVLDQQMEAGGTRYSGIRLISANDPDVARQAEPHLLESPGFRAGFSELAARKLTFDAWLYHPQLTEVENLAKAFPDVPIMVCHAGGLIGVGRFANSRGQAFSEWKAALSKLAGLPNVSLKVGGLAMPVFGLGLERVSQGDYASVAAIIRPIVETCIEIFGTDRCVFESNFSVGRENCTYGDLWNAYKHVTAAFSADERANLFAGNAIRFYRLDL